AEAEAEAERIRLERETAFKQQEAEFNQLVQKQADTLKELVLTATLARKHDETMAELTLAEERDRVAMALREKEGEIERLHQEIRNLINEGDLASRLIEKMPEIAAQMPGIDELKILQTGDGDAAFDAFAGFIAKTVAMADNLGIPLRLGKETDLTSASDDL
ncbi:MAG: hypothetical protein AAF485_33055, partial [Chloroflexota bacterium]